MEKILNGDEHEVKQKAFFLFHVALGFVFTLLGAFAIWALFEKDSFLPASFFTSTALEVFLLLIGLFFIREAVRNRDSQERFVHFVVGLSLFFFSLFPILLTLGFLKLLPYYIDLHISPFVLAFLLFFAGMYMIFDRIFLLIS